MLGKPKFKHGDLVTFNIVIDNVETPIIGNIYIIDEYGTFEDSSDVSYDIMSDNCLYKHIREDKVSKINS